MTIWCAAIWEMKKDLFDDNTRIKVQYSSQKQKKDLVLQR